VNTEWESWTDEKCIEYQRMLTFRMNLMVNRTLTKEEYEIRLREFDEFTEWLWNKGKT
jgi:hypothetical protein